jgi:hypothetical protein
MRYVEIPHPLEYRVLHLLPQFLFPYQHPLRTQ